MDCPYDKSHIYPCGAINRISSLPPVRLRSRRLIYYLGRVSKSLFPEIKSTKMKKDFQHLAPQTRAVHAGEIADPHTGATTPNIVMASTYKADPNVGFSVVDQDHEAESAYIYTRWGNPTLQQLSEKLAALEEAESCLVFGSGMAAISTLLIHTLQPGDHLVMSDISYAGASELANEILPKMNIRISRVNMSDLKAVEASVELRHQVGLHRIALQPIMPTHGYCSGSKDRP